MQKMKITFFTTSLFTDIQAVQSGLIKKHFPECEHVLIDGRNGIYPHTWYQWLKLANCDYAIHVDEDCFINDRIPILETIEKMETQNFHIAGTRDGGTVMRENNPFAMNSFFLITRKEAITVPDKNRFFIDSYGDQSPSNFARQLKMGRKISVSYDHNVEPYYDYFWHLKNLGLNFLYLEDSFDEELSTTNIFDDSVVHAWYLRCRNVDQVVDVTHKMTNKKRFDQIIKKVSS